MKQLEELLHHHEELPAIDHEIWSDWMKYLFSVSKLNENGSVTIPPDKVEKLKRLMDTPYDKLSETERERKV